MNSQTPPSYDAVRADGYYISQGDLSAQLNLAVRVGVQANGNIPVGSLAASESHLNVDSSRIINWNGTSERYFINSKGESVFVVSHDRYLDIMAIRTHAAITSGRGGVESVYGATEYVGDDVGGEMANFVSELAEYRQRQYVQDVADLGSTLGSSLGRAIAGDSAVLGVLYSSLLGEIGERLGISLASGGNADQITNSIALDSIGNFGAEVAARAGQAAVGSISSWLTMELGSSLGVRGFGAELFQTAGSTVTNQVVGNLLQMGPEKIFNGINLHEIGEGLGAGASLASLMSSAVGSFLGAKLGSVIVSPTTQAGMVLSSIGSAAGSLLALKGIGIIGTFASAASGAVASAASSVFGTKVGTWIGNAVLPGVGAFVGFVVGALIGNLFGRKKPKTPTANAEVYLDYTSDQFQLGASSAANGGNLQLVRDMATSARDTLNGFLTVLAGDMPYDAPSWGRGLWRNGKYIASEAGLQSFYGHTGGQLWVKTGSPTATQQNVASADDAVSKGVMWSIKQTQVIGGDIFAKRALANSAATDLTALLGDLQIASDYRFYAENRELINGYITGAYNSLTEAEKTYYASNKALIDKAHTEGVDALTTAQKTIYNANKAKIDKIILALEDQAIANPLDHHSPAHQ